VVGAAEAAAERTGSLLADLLRRGTA